MRLKNGLAVLLVAVAFPVAALAGIVPGKDWSLVRSEDSKPVFLVTATGKWTSFANRGHEDAVAVAPGYEWIYGDPTSIAKFRRMGFNAVNLFAAPTDFLGLLSKEPPCADPADDYAQLERVGRAGGWFEALLPNWTRKPEMWSSFTAQVRALGDTPFYVDFHTPQLSMLSNKKDSLTGILDPDATFYSKKPVAAFNMAFRLTRPEGAESIAALYRRMAETYQRLGSKPFAYKLLNEPSYTDDTPELRAQAAEWMRSMGVEPGGDVGETGRRRWRETLSARAMARVREVLREVEPDVPAFIQIHGGAAWRKAWTGIDLYKMNRAMDIVSIGTGGNAYAGESAPAGTRFADAMNPNGADHFGCIAYYRALARGKPMVASELYFPTAPDGRRERPLEAVLWHVAADGLALANLWEWGTPKKPDSNHPSYALWDPLICHPSTWDALPRMVREINALGDFFPLGVRKNRARVACLFPSAMRTVNPERTAAFSKAVAALEMVQIRADAIFEEQLVPGADCRTGDYGVIVASGVTATFPGTDEALVQWMDAGGRLILIDSPMDCDSFGRALAAPPRCLAHPNAVHLEPGASVFRRALELRDLLAGFGVRPAAVVRDEETGDLAPFVRAVRSEGSDGLVCWFFANYSATPRLVSVEAPDFARPCATAVPPFGERAWPIRDGRLLVLVPARFHALAATGDPAALARRFGRKAAPGEAALRKEARRMAAESLASAPRRASVPVDLSAIANGGFDNQQNFPVDTVWEDASGRCLKSVPFHKQTFADIDFDIVRFDFNENRTTLAMKSKSRPEGIADTGQIPLGSRQIRGLAILHAATNAKDGDIAYAFEVRYADGRFVRQAVRVGHEIGSWVVDDNGDAVKKSCVWKNGAGRGLFLYEWENPRPSDPVASFRLVGGNGESRGNIVAVSALPTRFTKRFARRIDIAKGPFTVRKGEHPEIKPENGGAWPLSPEEMETGVIRFQIAHAPKPGVQPQFHTTSLGARGRFPDGKESVLTESAVMFILARIKKAIVESVASPDDWAEVELPLSAFTRGKGASDGERKFVAITALIFGEQANLDYAYREVRFETNPQKEENDR